MISKDNVYVQAIVTKKQQKQLKTIAKNYKWTISKLIGHLIERFLEDKK